MTSAGSTPPPPNPRPRGGEHTFSRYGWKYTAAGWEPVPEEQATLARILELRAEGKGARRIAAALNSEGRRARCGKRWHHFAIHRLLRRNVSGCTPAVTAPPPPIPLPAGLRYRNGAPVRDPRTRPALLRAVVLSGRGMSLRDIARALTEEGYPTPRGAPAWSAKLIWWILRRRSLPSFVHGSLGARGVEKGGRLGRSVPRRRLSPEERQDLDDAEVRRLRALRPKTRGDCEGGPRPCAWVSCKWHLALDVDKETGVVRLNFPRGAEYRGEIDWEGMRESCALDVADRGDVTSLEEVGDITGLSKVAVLKIGREALAKAYDAGLALDPFVEE